jgi:hypothetical protein
MCSRMQWVLYGPSLVAVHPLLALHRPRLPLKKSWMPLPRCRMISLAQNGTLYTKGNGRACTRPGKVFFRPLVLVLTIFHRNFAASQILNVGCAIHDKFSSKALAEEAWVHALTEPGWVQVLN